VDRSLQGCTCRARADRQADLGRGQHHAFLALLIRWYRVTAAASKTIVAMEVELAACDD
jgi:hypothetical protein